MRPIRHKPDRSGAQREGKMVAADSGRLLEILVRTSFRSEDTPVFKLASGKMSQYYVDCKQALSYPEARELIGALIFNLIKGEEYDAVGGLEIGAYPIATSVSDRIFRETGKSVRAFVVRKNVKPHGIQSLVAGDVHQGQKALIVDDVITTGTSTIDAIQRARAAGLAVSRAIVLVDREEGDGKRNIEHEDVRCTALFTLADLLRASKQNAANARPHPSGPESAKSAGVN
jgi:orotate phosphoribosyltransferase